LAELPAISVVTPSLDQGAFIGAAIESVLAQDVPSVEHIIVEGGSHDETRAVLARHPHVRVVDQPARGQSDAINVGFAMASAPIVAWLNADDLYLPDVFGSVVEAFERHPAAGAIYGNCLEIDEDGATIGMITAGPFERGRLLDGLNNIPQPAAFIRRSLIDRIGPLDASLHYVMDYEFWLRAAEVSELVWVDEPWACFRHQAASKTMSQWHAFYPEARRVARAHGGRRFSPAWRLRYGNLAYLKWRLRNLL
jgi:glycosyltransferase involved in cell wall biosynthesis